MLLKGKVAIVTGSGRGLGRAFALALSAAGACVVVNARSASHVASVVEEIRRHGGSAEGCVASVHTIEGANQIVRTAIDKFGHLDILVNNAGITRFQPLVQMKEEDFDEVISVDLKGVFNCTSQAISYMVKQKWGRIINVASAAVRGTYAQTGYSAAKGGVLAMTACWAQELRQYGITCNAFRTAAATDLTRPLIEKMQKAAMQRGETPPTAADQGFFDPEIAATVVVFLASDQADWITGQFVSVDGPRIALWAYPHPVASAIMPGGWTTDTLIQHFKSALGMYLQSSGTLDQEGKMSKL